MGLRLTADHFWHVKLGKPLTRVSDWDWVGQVPILCTRRSGCWVIRPGGFGWA